jgi:sialic acid synthase SpsE
LRQIKLGKKTIGDGQPTFVIAEMAWSFDGSLEKAKKIVKGASDANADAISIHVTSVKDYMVKAYGSTAGQTVSAGKETEIIFDYLDRVNLKQNDFKELFAYAKSLGLVTCAMPNDMVSLKLCENSLKPDAYVIAAAVFVEESTVVEIGKQKVPVLLRIGGATLGEIETTANRIREQGNEDIILLHGFQSYPTKIENSRLRLIPSFKAIFGLPVGLADHIDAESPLAHTVPLVALGFGANVIEKHVTHDRSLKGEDFESALNPDELKKLVSDIRDIEKSFGPDWFGPLSAEEIRYRKVSRKRSVAVRPIKKGKALTAEDIVFKRADDGISPDEIRFIIGRTAKEDIKEDVPLTWDLLL